MFDMKPICKTCSKPKTLQRTGVTQYWLCVPCHKASAPLEPEYRAVETFPRGPSNEQTLLTELKKFKDFVAKNHPEVVEEYDKS